jgi:hypothetical protein
MKRGKSRSTRKSLDKNKDNSKIYIAIAIIIVVLLVLSFMPFFHIEKKETGSNSELPSLDAVNFWAAVAILSNTFSTTTPAKTATPTQIPSNYKSATQSPNPSPTQTTTLTQTYVTIPPLPTQTITTAPTTIPSQNPTRVPTIVSTITAVYTPGPSPTVSATPSPTATITVSPTPTKTPTKIPNPNECEGKSDGTNCGEKITFNGVKIYYCACKTGECKCCKLEDLNHLNVDSKLLNGKCVKCSSSGEWDITFYNDISCGYINKGIPGLNIPPVTTCKCKNGQGVNCDTNNLPFLAHGNCITCTSSGNFANKDGDTCSIVITNPLTGVVKDVFRGICKEGVCLSPN